MTMIKSEYGFNSLLIFVPYLDFQKIKAIESLQHETGIKGGNLLLTNNLRRLLESLIAFQSLSSYQKI